jgi:nucleotide-binding universal stress UspA family protein
VFRDLLVHVGGSEAGRRRVRFAADVAQRMGARLSGLHVTPPPEVPPLYKPSLGRYTGVLPTAAGQGYCFFS